MSGVVMRKISLPKKNWLASEEKKWKDPVVISVLVPAYRTPEVFLKQMMESVPLQTYPYPGTLHCRWKRNG